ncbi:PREDICTED: GDSL esterase/lipase At5g55050-like [Lupinus angustifolius]|uniref:GDSL esterase/lipase At5g55050-like n=1 Tax=Lupinus angustifolius TaxID=3871 RepID=UPI00092EDA39|nr:PREDICTED: GDSL esterase/lipase At5g55050-like [Lupinus angustifolius]
MGNRVMLGSSFLFIIFFIFNLAFLEAQVAPPIYVFGDSLVDVGNNNYLLLSIEKAILPHYGIDFPTKKPNGRFSNGKNAADLIAEKLGVPTSPPYLSLISLVKNNKNSSFLDGVSFASGGAGIFDGKNDLQSIPFTKQVDYYSQVHEQMTQQIGAPSLQKRLSKSIFAVVIGSNDIFGYFNSKDLQNKSTPQQYADSMVTSLKVQLQRVYNYGARKFVIVGVSAIGCCPALRLKNETECAVEANLLSVKYNDGLKSMMKGWQLEKNDIRYSYFDTYAALQDLIQNPSSYGFAEVKGACCGLGKLNAQIPCLPISKICFNRQNHVFWDPFHPTEAAARIFVDRIFNGPAKYTSPINMKQLLPL